MCVCVCVCVCVRACACVCVFTNNEINANVDKLLNCMDLVFFVYVHMYRKIGRDTES